jgi:hypothetical protein
MLKYEMRTNDSLYFSSSFFCGFFFCSLLEQLRLFLWHNKKKDLIVKKENEGR